MKRKIIYITILAVFSLFLVGIFSAPVERRMELGVPLSVVQNKGVQTLQKVTLPGKVSELVNQIRVDIMVSSTTYPVTISADKDIYEAMGVLASTTAFNFKAKYFSGLGYFIEEINGLKNKDGFYWTLYINGTYSNVGVSEYILKEGDQVEWKFEKK
jgi:hypothetical protein